MRVRAHYDAVLVELEAAAVTHLDSDQRSSRARLVEALRVYREREDFGRADNPNGRQPWFVDAEGRRCAVAELLHVTGEHETIERVRATDNHAWILDLAGDAAFEAWLTRNGLEFDEAARIQCPALFNPAAYDAVPSPSSGGPPPPAGGSYGGPADTVGLTGGGGGPPPPSGPGSATGAPGAVTPGSSRTPGGEPLRGGGRPTALGLSTTEDDSWWLWWEYSKAEFLVPNRLSLANAPTTGDDVAGALREAIERTRRSELPRFVEAARSSDAWIRAAAATALGASGGRDALEPLVRLLDDPSQDVRHRALLALGATGTTSAVITLLRIAREGTHVEGSRSRISPYARPLAVVALGLALRAGSEQRVDAALRTLVGEARGSEREALAIATMFHHVLFPSTSLEELALELALDERESPSVRCRAVEALASAKDPKTLAKLQTLLSGPRLDLRRSAALALGATRELVVLPALMTAFELEAEVLTRGFVLIGIGRLGGAKAHAFLSKILVAGESGQRRWAALALGVLARETGDPETSKLLRGALEREKSAEGRAAYWLALGLLRDELAIDAIAEPLASAADPRQRMYAATALSLLGGARCAAVLRERLPRESNPLALVGISQGLGILGENQDVVAMRAALNLLAEPGLQGVAATALAFHGTPEALAQLAELSRADHGTRVRKAAAIEGLGLMLSRGDPLRLTNLSRRMNYTVMPDWAAAIFQTTL
ncbi:MAG: HEAT repeat domain-containing protein [Planctomycetes bacterium]|nr:HEAT repeat domain-containing protein [Planctomycetota bacterium]